MEPWRPPAALAGLLAAVGIALKPYFILFWVSTATYAWLATRGRLVWRDPEHLVIADSHAIYAAAVLTLAPGYLEVVRRLGTTYLERWCLQMPGRGSSPESTYPGPREATSG